MKRILLAAAIWAAFAGAAFAQMKSVKSTYLPGEAIVLELDASQVPDNAIIQPNFRFAVDTTAERYEIKQPAPSIYHMWASGGDYKITAIGMWGVPIPNEPGKWGSFGLIFEELKFSVAGGDSPPPPLPGDRRAIILEETLERTPEFDILRNQLLRKYPTKQMMILDDDNPLAQKYVSLSKIQSRPVLLVLQGDTLIREVACPSSVAGVELEVSR